MSTTQHLEKKSRRANELLRASSKGSDPRRSTDWSKIVLKSPKTKVGIQGSTTSAQPSKKSFLAMNRFGAYTQRTRKDSSRMANSGKTSIVGIVSKETGAASVGN